MTNQDILKKMLDEYKDYFNKNFKELMKTKNNKKRYALAQIISSLNLTLKYIFLFENVDKEVLK